MVPLPENPFTATEDKNAYNQCMTLEAESHVEHIRGFPPPIVCARLLGHLLRLAPPSDARDKIREDIISAQGNEQLMQLAALYFGSFLRVFRRSRGPTRSSSRPSVETLSIMEKRTATTRNSAMRRDNHCCIVTGKKHFRRGGGVMVETAHIIPPSISEKIGPDTKKRHHPGGAWALLSMFNREDDVLEYLAGNKIDRPENILSLNAALHGFFDELQVCLRPVQDDPNTYLIRAATEAIKIDQGLPEQVTFSTDTDIPLPRSDLLAIHALCCEVTWMSGAAEYIMDMERRMEDDSKVLAKDGSNVDILVTALLSLESVTLT